MHLKFLLDNLVGCGLVLFCAIYFAINLYLSFLYYIRGEKRRYLKKIMFAFLSFFICVAVESLGFFLLGPRDSSGVYLSVLAMKLFVLSSVFILFMFQSVGFMDEGLVGCMRYQGALYLLLLLIDAISLLCGIDDALYMVILSGLMIAVIYMLLYKFCVVCSSRYSSIVQSASKDDFICAIMAIGVVGLAVYIILISAIHSRNGFIGFLSALMVLSLHLYFLYKSHKIIVSPKSYVPVRSVEREVVQESSVCEERLVDYYKIIQRLILYFEREKPFLDADLKLADVAQKLYTNKSYLSRALNHKMSKNFNQFVNYYRVKEACRIYLEDPSLKLGELCDRCGFKNLSSFSNAFNLNMHYTPAEWCKEVRRRLSNNESVSVKDYIS